MPGKDEQERTIISHVTSRRPTLATEGALAADPHEAMESHGPAWRHHQYGMDLDGYVGQFNEQVIGAYNAGREGVLPADAGVARSIIPPGTGVFRDFSHVAPELPLFNADNCVACMECVTTCPDTAILAKVCEAELVETKADTFAQEETGQAFRAHWATTTKFHGLFEKKGETGGLFAIYVDPTKCKGCGECVVVCGKHAALEMAPKSEELVYSYQDITQAMRELPETPQRYYARKLPVDLMLGEDRSLLYVGGAGSCAGCGEATAIRMMLAQTGDTHEAGQIGIVAATGCNTVYGSTYPYNPYRVTWVNSLFENAPTVAMGIRLRWDQAGLHDNRLWVLGGDGAMYDIGFQALSRMLASGMDIKVLVLDTQVYSNTGGQASTSTPTSAASKMAPHGKARPGKMERRKELSNIALMHPDVYVAQTSTAYITHFYQAIREANAYNGPAVVNVFTTCQPEHGVADDVSQVQARRAVVSRAFPLFIHDPTKGERLSERMSLRGNPALTEDWAPDPDAPKDDKTPFDFVAFARTEGRFAKQFNAQGSPSEALLGAQEDRRKNWRLLKELAGVG